MNIPEAIEILSEYVNQPYSKFHPDHTDSVKLGIEALKREKEHRLYETHGVRLLLPGETDH
ncbi:hypothetical protein ES705_23067 [subsurface metagenome]